LLVDQTNERGGRGRQNGEYRIYDEGTGKVRKDNQKISTIHPNLENKENDKKDRSHIKK
jgi:hypothetical protein